MNAALFFAHITGQPHIHSHDFAATVVALFLTVAFMLVLRRTP